MRAVHRVLRRFAITRGSGECSTQSVIAVAWSICSSRLSSARDRGRTHDGRSWTRPGERTQVATVACDSPDQPAPAAVGPRRALPRRRRYALRRALCLAQLATRLAPASHGGGRAQYAQQAGRRRWPVASGIAQAGSPATAPSARLRRWPSAAGHTRGSGPPLAALARARSRWLVSVGGLPLQPAFERSATPPQHCAPSTLAASFCPTELRSARRR